MEQLHQAAALANEDEQVAVLHVAPHPLMRHPAQRADTLAHVRPAKTQIIAHRVVKAEHGSSGFVQQITQHILGAAAEVGTKTVGEQKRCTGRHITRDSIWKRIAPTETNRGQVMNAQLWGAILLAPSNCRWNNMYLSAGGTASVTDHSLGDLTVTAETLPWS